MSPAGLFALVLSVTPADLAAFPLAPPPAPVTRWEGITSPYNPPAREPVPARHAVQKPGRATVADVPDDVSGRISLVDGVITGPAGRSTVAQTAAAHRVGQVFEPAYTIDPDLSHPPAAYEPQVGDLVLTVSDNVAWQLLFTLALSKEPYHAAIVVQSGDGSFGLLEAGPPDETPFVRVTPLADRLAADSGRVYVRRRTTPLSADQAAALNGFAARQVGKPYAVLRFLCQGTPFRCRGPIRTEYIGKCRGECFSYFCSELVIESIVSAGLIDGETARPRATTPSDIFHDESENPWINKHLKLYPGWNPPQRWVAEACVGK